MSVNGSVTIADSASETEIEHIANESTRDERFAKSVLEGGADFGPSLAEETEADRAIPSHTYQLPRVLFDDKRRRWLPQFVSGCSPFGGGSPGESGSRITAHGAELFRQIREAFGVSDEAFLASLGIRQVCVLYSPCDVSGLHHRCLLASHPAPHAPCLYSILVGHCFSCLSLSPCLVCLYLHVFVVPFNSSDHSSSLFPSDVLPFCCKIRKFYLFCSSLSFFILFRSSLFAAETDIKVFFTCPCFPYFLIT